MKLTDKGREEIQELTWRLVDDEIDATQFNRLETVLRESGDGRKTYVECMWLHSELVFYFRNERGEVTAIKFVDDPLTRMLAEPAQSDKPGKSAAAKPRKKRGGLLSLLWFF